MGSHRPTYGLIRHIALVLRHKTHTTAAVALSMSQTKLAYSL